MMRVLLLGLSAGLMRADVLGRTDTVGGTTYDYQQSGPTLVTIVNEPGTALHVSWMYSAIQGQNYPDRNKRYNYFDRSLGAWSWLDTIDFLNSGVSCYLQKCGYGTLAVNPVTGCAYVSAHYTTWSTIVQDLAPGVGVFEECGGPPSCSGYVWPVSAFGQDEVVHNAMIDAGSRSQVWYSRIDPWCTWSDPVYLSEPPSVNPSYPSHFLAASQQSPTVLVSWADPLEDTIKLFIRSSTDGGRSWATPYALPPPPAFTPGSDTVVSYFVTGGFIAFDAQDNWHLVTTVCPMVDGMVYVLPAEIWHYRPNQTPAWSRVVRAECDTLHLGGMVGDNVLFCDRPSIGFVPGNSGCFVAWEQFDSLNVEPSTGLLRADIYIAGSRDNGVTWDRPRRITEPNSASKRFPCLAAVVDDTLHILYEEDLIAGFPIRSQGAITDNPMVYHRVPAGVGLAESQDARERADRVQVFPQPFRNRVRFSAPGRELNSLVISDAAGRAVWSWRAGPTRPVDVQWSGQTRQGRAAPPGVYFYRLATNTGLVSGKLLKVE